MHFDVKRIGDICKRVCSGGTPTSSNAAYYDGGIPWLNTNEVNFCNIYSTNRTISEEGLNHSAAKLIPANSVIVAMYGVTAGKSAIAKIPLTTNQACCNLIIDEEKAHYQYVYHFLKLQSDNLNKLANGGAQQNLNSIIIKKFKINLPSLEIQRRIASILSAYDNLIENNTRRIRLLEQMAENLYKEWFVRFRFPGHEKAEFENGLPKGWRNFALGDRYDITIGKTPPRKEFQWFTHNDLTAQNWMSISDMKEMFTGNTSEQLTQEAIKKFNMVVVPEKTILLSFKLTVGRITIATQPLCTNEAIAHIKNVPEIEHEFLYQQLKNYEYAKLGNTSAIGNAVNSKIIKRMAIIVPNEDILKSFHKITFPVFEQIKLLSSQNENLAQQRDLLLPRLMSGKLEVKI